MRSERRNSAGSIPRHGLERFSPLRWLIWQPDSLLIVTDWGTVDGAPATQGPPAHDVIQRFRKRAATL